MSDPLQAAKEKARATYNAAADNFAAEPLAFWNRIGRRTVDRLNLAEGHRVLDVCCGAGASAIPAAGVVGPLGSVVAVDLADELLELGRQRAESAGLAAIEFRRGDMTALDFPEAAFDAVVCVFGIFFVPEMEAQVARLWRLVRPGGQLAITTWGPGIFSPAYEIWLEAVARVRPELASAFNPWDRITTTDSVAKLLADGGVAAADVVAEEAHQPLGAGDDFWTIALGSGLRWTIDQLGPELADRVRREVVGTIDEREIDRVATGAIYAVARKPASA